MKYKENLTVVMVQFKVDAGSVWVCACLFCIGIAIGACITCSIGFIQYADYGDTTEDKCSYTYSAAVDCRTQTESANGKGTTPCDGRQWRHFYHASNIGCVVYDDETCDCGDDLEAYYDPEPLYQYDNSTTCWVNGCGEDLTFDHHKTSPLMGIISSIVLGVAIISVIFTIVMLWRTSK